MCLRLNYHHLACDVRPRVSRGANGGPIVDPYTTPNPCPSNCPGKEHIAPYFRCLKHHCCLTSFKYVRTGAVCKTKCNAQAVIDYHVYDQRIEVTAITEQWEKLPTIDSYIPRLGIAIPNTPRFRAWRTELLAKGALVHRTLQLMDLTEQRMVLEYQQQRAEQSLNQELRRNWEKYRRYPAEPRPKKFQAEGNIDRLWKVLYELTDLLKMAEGEYQALQTPNPPFGETDTGLITSLAPVQNYRDVHANWDKGYLGEMKDTIHQMAMFRF